ncbi:MAG: macro domain-containing protein [Bacteroidota bacterium]
MIHLKRGNLLEASAEALVNTVNCVGVMGKGIALQFKQAYPENYKIYKKVCDQHALKTGMMLVHDRGGLEKSADPPRYIINFPTKNHWRGKSKMADIESGLQALIEEIHTREIKSIAIPPLGCGNGGLNWNDVRTRIEQAFAVLPDVEVQLFAPGNAPTADKIPIRTKKPNMTQGTALIVFLMALYKVMNYKIGLLEIQKLLYFLQASGVPLKLDFKKERYGPYAEAVHHMLQRMAGHYIEGYGDRADIKTELTLSPNAISEAKKWLEQQEERELLSSHLTRIRELAEGFESPYGMELLASTHWVFQEDGETAKDPEKAIAALHAWNERKRKQLKPEHIIVAWDHLRELGWVNLPSSARVTGSH